MTEKTEKITTAWGETNVETVTCDSCGQEELKENAKRFFVGEVEEHNKYGTISDTWEFNDRTLRKGWACGYCASEGMVSYPQRVTYTEALAYVALVLAALLSGLFVGVVVF